MSRERGECGGIDVESWEEVLGLCGDSEVEGRKEAKEKHKEEK